MPTLRMYLLGGLRAYYADEPLPPFPTHKTRSLLAYLVTFRHQTHPRAALAGAFWSGIPLAQAGRNLNTTLWRLRRVLPDGYLAVQGNRIGLDPAAPLWLDVVQFEQGLRQAGVAERSTATEPSLQEERADILQQALDLYRGDYLEGLDEEWALVEAERLHLLHLQALHALLLHRRAAGQYEMALDCARRLLAGDPLREETHRQAMELCALLGRPGEARAQFEACRQLLRDELGSAPAPETVSLHEAIRSAGRPAAAPPAPVLLTHPSPLPRTPFDDLGQVALVGRQDERAALLMALEAAGRGRGGVVLLEGEAGVGKSRLLDEAARYAAGRGWQVLRGSSPELHQPPPYQAWTAALRPARAWLHPAVLRRWLADLALLLPELRHLLPDLPPPSPTVGPQRQEQVQQALLHCLRAIGQARPALIALEDLQWADAATLESLRTVGPRLDGVAVLLVGTVRSEEIPPRLGEIVGELERGAALRRIGLQPLSRADTGRLSGAILGWAAPQPLFVERLYRETQGNPFLLIEVLKGLYEEGRLVRDRAGRWSLGRDRAEEEWPLPRGVRQAVERRLALLDGRSRALLEIAAVVGREAPADLLWEVCGPAPGASAVGPTVGQSHDWDEEAFLQASDDLLRRQLLVEAGERLRFVHGNVRQVIYGCVSPARRRTLHSRVGEILERRTPDQAEEIADHLYLGQQYARALPYCLQAGERALSVYAAASALTYYSWAISAAGHARRAAARPALLQAHEGRGQAFDHLGDLQSAAAEFEAQLAVARESGDPAAVARAIRLAGWARGYRQNNWDLGLREAQRAYDVATAAGATAETAAALRDIGAYRTLRGQHEAGLEAHRAALLYARQSGDAAEEATNLQYIAVTHMFLSQNEQALEAFQQALAIRERLGDRWIAARILSNLGLLQINRGEFTAAEQYLRRAEEGFEAIGALPPLPIVWIGLATLYRYHGACAESLQVLERALEVNAATGGSSYDRSLILYHRACAAWDVGRLGPALADLGESSALARQSNTPTLLVGQLNAMAGFLLQVGANEQAAVVYQEALGLSRQAAFAGGEAAALAGLGLAELAAGQETGRERLGQAGRLVRRQAAHARSEVLLALAEAALADWRLASARALAQRALVLAEAVGVRSLTVRALLLLGEALAGLDRPGEAEGALRRALDLGDPPGYPTLRWLILESLGRLLAEQGRTAEAGHTRAQACSLVENILATLPERSLRDSFGALPAVRALLGETEDAALRPGQVRRQIARLGAPTGRPLLPHERVSVVWTLDCGAGDAALLAREGKAALRRRRIVRLLGEALAQGGDPSEADLAAALGVSTRTVRSDVAALRQSGRQVRTRGARPAGR